MPTKYPSGHWREHFGSVVVVGVEPDVPVDFEEVLVLLVELWADVTDALETVWDWLREGVLLVVV